MYSDRYVALHCCQEKYFDGIKSKGIARETKAVFICDLQNIECNEIYNTLAVLIYHGIGIDGWTSVLKENKKLNEIDKNLIILMAKISKDQENIIKNKELLHHYTIYNKNGKTMDYCKIKDIGTIEKIVFTEKIHLHHVRINDIENINPASDRFFIKSTYNNFKLEGEKTIKQIETICYKIAYEKFKIIKEKILRIMN